MSFLKRLSNYFMEAFTKITVDLSTYLEKKEEANLADVRQPESDDHPVTSVSKQGPYFKSVIKANEKVEEQDSLIQTNKQALEIRSTVNVTDGRQPQLDDHQMTSISEQEPQDRSAAKSNRKFEKKDSLVENEGEAFKVRIIENTADVRQPQLDDDQVVSISEQEPGDKYGTKSNENVKKKDSLSQTDDQAFKVRSITADQLEQFTKKEIPSAAVLIPILTNCFIEGNFSLHHIAKCVMENHYKFLREENQNIIAGEFYTALRAKGSHQKVEKLLKRLERLMKCLNFIKITFYIAVFIVTGAYYIKNPDPDKKLSTDEKHEKRIANITFGVAVLASALISLVHWSCWTKFHFRQCRGFWFLIATFLLLGSIVMLIYGTWRKGSNTSFSDIVSASGPLLLEALLLFLQHLILNCHCFVPRVD